MISERARRELEKLIKGKILFDEQMKKHTSLHIGGPADTLVTPKDETDLKSLLKYAMRRGIPITAIGNGTKLLVSDKGIDGIVIKISNCFNNVAFSGTKVLVGAGYSLAILSRLAADSGLSGLEFAVGIPGTIGGAVVMNAGAHGSAISQVINGVTMMNMKGEVTRCTKSDLEFGYRQSILQKSRMVVLSAEIKLEEDDRQKIKKRMRKFIEWRRKNQPLDLPNAGSIFKNPPGVSTGKLIDLAGLKNMMLGDAKISGKRANFFINAGKATAYDMISLIRIVQKKILQRYGIKLELEIRIIGRFKEKDVLSSSCG